MSYYPLTEHPTFPTVCGTPHHSAPINLTVPLQVSGMFLVLKGNGTIYLQARHCPESQTCTSNQIFLLGRLMNISNSLSTKPNSSPLPTPFNPHYSQGGLHLVCAPDHASQSVTFAGDVFQLQTCLGIPQPSGVFVSTTTACSASWALVHCPSSHFYTQEH